MTAAPPRLGQILLDQAALKPGDLDEALELQAQLGRPLGEVLVALGMATAEDVARALSRQLGRPAPVVADPIVSGTLAGSQSPREGAPAAKPPASHAIDACRRLLTMQGTPAPVATPVRVSCEQVDLVALAALGSGFCALYGLLPLLSPPAPAAPAPGPEPRTIAAAFPVHPSVLSRLAARLHRPVTVVMADPLEVDAVLAALQARAAAPVGSAAGARTLEVLASLEADGALEALAAAQARASALGLVTRAVDPGPLDWPLLPPGQAGTAPIHIDVRSVQEGQLVLVTAHPTPRLARAMAALHPGWAIAWEVALPEPPATAAAQEDDSTWPNTHPGRQN